jgi:cobalamin biosynthesis protein CobT
MSHNAEIELKVKMYCEAHDGMKGLPHMSDACKKMNKVKMELSNWFKENSEPGFLKKIQKDRKSVYKTSDKKNKTSDKKNKTSDKKNKTSDNNNKTSDKKNKTSDKKNKTSDNNNKTSDNNNNKMSDKEEDDNYETEVATLALVPCNHNWFLEEYMNYEAERFSPMVSLHNLEFTWHDGPQA